MNQNSQMINNDDAERAVLGCMLVEPFVIPRIVSVLGSSDDMFYTLSHNIIYTSILNVYERTGKTDALLVADVLKKNEQLNRVGGTNYIYDLLAPIVETESAEHYAEIVKEKALRRKMVSLSQEIREVGFDEGVSTTEAINQCQEKVMDLSLEHHQNGFETIRDSMVEALDTIGKAYENEGRIGLTTGFMAFDELTAGFQKGQLIVIAARPSVGKTSFVLNIASHVARNQEKPVGFFSLEMPSHDLVTRLLSSESGIDLARLRTGRLDEYGFKQLQKANDALQTANLFINDNGRMTITDLRAETRRLRDLNGGLSLLVVDYLQLMRSEGGKYTNREQEVATLSRELKRIAQELDVPVIACAQLNREVERRPGKEPNLSDLRESGSIEQDADIVAFLHRDADVDMEDDVQEIMLLIKKQRNGATGAIPLRFNRRIVRFESESY